MDNINGGASTTTTTTTPHHHPWGKSQRNDNVVAARDDSPGVGVGDLHHDEESQQHDDNLQEEEDDDDKVGGDSDSDSDSDKSDYDYDDVAQLLVLLGSSQHEERCCSGAISTATTSTSSSSASSSSSSDDSTRCRDIDVIENEEGEEEDDNDINPLLRCFSKDVLKTGGGKKKIDGCRATTNNSTTDEEDVDKSNDKNDETDNDITSTRSHVLLSLPAFPSPSSSKTFLPILSSSTGSCDSSNSTTKEDLDLDLDSLKFSIHNIHDAPIVWLRHFQDVFKNLLKQKIEEWKNLLVNHYGDVVDAQKLVASLEKGLKKKLIVSCRGHTTVNDISVVSSKQQPQDRKVKDFFVGADETQSHTSSVLECTEEGLGTTQTSSLKATTDESTLSDDVDSTSKVVDHCVSPKSSSPAQNRRACVEFALNLELLVKLRKGHRSFATSCYTVHLKAPKMVATAYSVCPSPPSSEMTSNNNQEDGNLSCVKVSWNDECGDRDRDGQTNVFNNNGDGDGKQMLQAMKHRVEQLALKAVASHAIDTSGISQRWKSPTFLNKLWNVQDKEETLVPVSRGFLTTTSSRKKTTDHNHQMSSDEEASVLSIQTSSTLSSLGSKSTSVPYVVSTSTSTSISSSFPTTKARQRQPQQHCWNRTVWFRSMGHALVFTGLFFTSLVCLQFHSLLHFSAMRMWNNFVDSAYSASSWTPSTTMLSVYDLTTLVRLPVQTDSLASSSSSSTSSSSSSSRSDLGISFQRSIHDIPQDETFSFTLSLDDATNHCATEDQYGPNNCHYDWNDSVKGSYLVEVKDDDKVLTEQASIEVTAMLDNRVPYNFECQLCGQDCVLKIPVFNVHTTIPMPACPLSLHNRTASFDFHLWSSSPTDGWLTIPVTASGIVYESPGVELASFDLHLTAK